MCGIYAYLLRQGKISKEYYEILCKNFYKTKARGPESTNEVRYYEKLFLGFHRLAIIDGTENGMQPFHDKDCVFVICNGEVYNHLDLKRDLKKEFGALTLKSESDCEIILHLYLKYGFEETVRKLYGVFALVIYDDRDGIMYAARDPYGVRPLFMSMDTNNEIYLCSEAKGITYLAESVRQFPPGTMWNSSSMEFTYYYNYVFKSLHHNIGSILEKIRILLERAVKFRLMSDRQIGCLLSGGLDSSLIAALVNKNYTGQGKLFTFSIGLEGSTDLKYARIAADYIGTRHHEIIYSKEKFLGYIPEVIYQIGSYDVTTVRASLGNYLVAKMICCKTNCKVIFNGDGSDEASGSYLYFKNAPSNEAFQKESLRLMKNIHYFDILRSQSIERHGLECRAPFLDTDFLSYYMSIEPALKTCSDRPEKWLLREAFANTNLLPKCIIYRRKEAFSDGVTTDQDPDKSLHKIIKSHVDTLITDIEFKKQSRKYKHNRPRTKEAYYYRKIFETRYPGHSKLIPYPWMPKWSSKMNDPSARELKSYGSPPLIK